ncbi:ATP-dependent sacrificial sulfur transferase LarE [bacterium]|nr:ATP-dependent sacrificial sulfur transferase LarE [bacterium]
MADVIPLNGIGVRVSQPIDRIANRLLEQIRSYPAPLIVAFSGGVDSTVVAKAATLALGAERVVCATAKSESNTDEDLELCRAIAAEHGLNLRVVEYSELDIPNYADNPANRCYFCKSELYTRLSGLAEREGFASILDGSNADDVGDYRPGLKAVKENGVRSPLREVAIDKATVRRLAEHFGLPNHDKPASPCLSSRVPYGQTITREKLDQIAAAERYIRGLGLREFRVRHHGEIARLEAHAEDFPALLASRDAIVAEFRRLGFQWVAMDLAGFKSGGLNALLAAANKTT